MEYFKVPIDDKTVANIITRRNDYNGESIRLLSCNVGKQTDGEICFAQRLSNRLKKEVIAPTDVLWVDQNGKITIGPEAHLNTGEWKKFTPQKEEQR